MYTSRLLLLFYKLEKLKNWLYKRNPLGIQTTVTQFTKLEMFSTTPERLIKFARLNCLLKNTRKKNYPGSKLTIKFNIRRFRNIACILFMAHSSVHIKLNNDNI